MFNKLPRTHLRGFMICSPWSPAWLALHRCCWFWTLCKGGIRGGWRLEPASISSAWFPLNVPKRKRRRIKRRRDFTVTVTYIRLPLMLSPPSKKSFFSYGTPLWVSSPGSKTSPPTLKSLFMRVIPGFGILSICALIVQIITAEQFWKCPALFLLTMSLRHYLAVPQTFRYNCLTIFFWSFTSCLWRDSSPFVINSACHFKSTLLHFP